MNFVDLDQPSEMNSPGADSANGPNGNSGSGETGSAGMNAPASLGRYSADFAIRPQLTGSMKSPDLSQSRVIQGLLNRVLDTTSAVAGRQAELIAKIQSEFGKLPKQAMQSPVGPRRSAATPSARTDGPRANYRPWGETIKQPIDMDAAKGMKRAANESGNGSEYLPGSGPSGRLKTTTAMPSPPVQDKVATKSAMPSPLNLTPMANPCYSTKMKSPESERYPSKSADKSQNQTISVKSPDNRDVRIQSMQHIHQKIVNHENKHAAILSDSGVSSAKPQFTQSTGPDGRKYATAGEVNTDLSPIPGKPHATEKKAESVYRSALHDSERSAEDEDAARKAMFAAQTARYEGLRKKAAKGFKTVDESGGGGGGLWAGGFGMDSPHNSSMAKTAKSQSDPGGSSDSMKSPYSVKMKFPPLGAALAAGAAWAGRAAMATGRLGAGALRGAGRYLGSAPRTGIGRFIGGAMTGSSAASRATVLAASFRSLESTSNRLESSFSNLADRLAIFSPDIMVQRAMNQFNRINQNIRQARQLGPRIAEFEKQQGRVEIARNETAGEFARFFLPMQTTLEKFKADALEMINSWLKSANDKIEDFGKNFGKNMGWAKDNVPYFKSFTEWVKRNWPWKETDKAKDLFDPNLNLFFNMSIPDHDAHPDFTPNPHFNMPIFGAKPLPNGVNMAAGMPPVF